MININKAFGKRIKFLRKQKGLTQLKFSNEASISMSYFAEIESGKMKRNPTLELMYKIAEKLDISLSELLLGVDIMNQNESKIKLKNEILKALKSLTDEKLNKILSMIELMSH